MQDLNGLIMHLNGGSPICTAIKGLSSYPGTEELNSESLVSKLLVKTEKLVHLGNQGMFNIDLPKNSLLCNRPPVRGVLTKPNRLGTAGSLSHRGC